MSKVEIIQAPVPPVEGVRLEFTVEEFSALLATISGRGTMRGAWQVLKEARDALAKSGETRPLLAYDTARIEGAFPGPSLEEDE